MPRSTHSICRNLKYVGLVLAMTSIEVNAESHKREATCANTTTCTLQFPVTSTRVSFPRALTCYWSQDDRAPVLRRVLLGHQPNGLPVVATVALPVSAEQASAYAFNQSVQSSNILALKGGKLNAQFEWSSAVTTTISCTYMYVK
jgi:hypothetical protein